MRNHTAKWLSMNLSKQPAGLKLTSMSGEQTFYEAATYVTQQETTELLPDWHWDNYIMGLTKPVEQYLFSNLLTKIHIVVYLKDIIRGDNDNDN